MNRQQFLIELKRSLGNLAEREKSEILYDYEEHFRAAAAEGKSEEEIAASLGNPRTLGRSFRVDAMLAEGSERNRAGSVVRAAFASLSLGFLNVVFVLGPFFAVVAVLVSLWAAAAALSLSGVAALLALILRPLLPQAVSLGGLPTLFVVPASVAVSAIGVLALLGMWQLTRLFWRGTARYLRLNARIVNPRIGR